MDAAELEALKDRVAAAEKVKDAMHRNCKAMNIPVNAGFGNFFIFANGDVRVGVGDECVVVVGVGKELLEHIANFFAGKVHAAAEEFKAI